MNAPHPANHICLRCQVAWHERGTHGTCWSCHQPAQPGTITDLLETIAHIWHPHLPPHRREPT